MSKFVLSFIACIILLNTATARQKNIAANTPETKALKGVRFQLHAQTFISHDRESTDRETISHPGDYIEFGENGMAYMLYDGKQDSLRYYFTDDNRVSFGDTPFEININGNGNITLYQKESGDNGSYNSVTYQLIKAEQNLSYSK